MALNRNTSWQTASNFTLKVLLTESVEIKNNDTTDIKIKAFS